MKQVPLASTVNNFTLSHKPHATIQIPMLTFYCQNYTCGKPSSVVYLTQDGGIYVCEKCLSGFDKKWHKELATESENYKKKLRRAQEQIGDLRNGTRK
jgi:hypothetical protein